MLKASDSIVQNAYARMDFTTKHAWSTNTIAEADFICNECELNPGDTLIDFGCGQGRHALAIAQKGIHVIGIDYIDKNVEIANKQRTNNNVKNLDFVLGDCRDVKIEEKAKAAICLYDVIGTYAENTENTKLLLNIANHLEIGSFAIISVMNYDLTASLAKHKFVFKDNPMHYSP